MRIVVTGGAGFIGSHLVDRLLSEGHEVFVLDALTYAGCMANLEDASGNAKFQFLEGSINDRKILDHIFQTFKPQAIVHTAAESHVDRSIDASDIFIQTNVVGTHCLLEATRSYWSRLQGQEKENFRFFHMSTDEVFGTMGPTERADEESPYRPRSPYAASKAAGDHIVRSYHITYGLPILIVHPSNTYGPRQYPEKLIPVVIKNALEGRPIPLYGEGKNEREWLYVADCVRAIDLVLQKGMVGESYCIGIENGVSNRSLVEKICHHLARLGDDKQDYQSMITLVHDRPGHDLRYAIEAHKLSKATQWQAENDLETGLGKTIAWYRAHPERLEVDYQRLGLKHAVH